MPAPESERVLAARIAAHTSWAMTGDRSARTAPARAAMRARFERESDPEGLLSPAERADRGESLRKAHYLRLSLKAAQARRKVKEATADAEAYSAEADELASLSDDSEGVLS